jgi:LemA protein
MNLIENNVKTISVKKPVLNPEKTVAAVGNKKIVVVVALVVVLAFFYTGESIYWYNRDVKEMAAVYAGAIMMERECKRKDDLIQNLMNITNEYARHEQTLFHYVSQMRSQIVPAGEMRGGPTVDNGDILTRIIALSEQYPDLKASQSYLDLMDMIETTEDRITTMRDKYITAVQDYNICNQQFWCPFFTTIINVFAPMPPFIEYFHYKSHFTGEWAKLQAPVMIESEISEKDKKELIQPTLFGEDTNVFNSLDTVQ